MWRVMPNVVHICSYGKFAHRIETIDNGTERMLFLREIRQIDEHPCHVVFVSENETLALPLAFKQKYGSCSVHSSALLHLASPPLSANETVTTYKLRVDPRGGLKGELFEGVDPDAHNIVSMVTLISSFVKRAMLMSVVINTRDANLFLPLFFANGAFEMATMSTCQLSIAYPKPKTIVEMEQFQTAWERLLHDRRFLPVQVVRNQDVMSMFLVSIASEYCWTKYISNIEQTKEFFVLAARLCMSEKSAFLMKENDMAFFNMMWIIMPNLVNICSYSKLHDRIETFQHGSSEMSYIRPREGASWS
ncbi:hypothetical protein Q1695_005273 [Nippostrongylus brasiliensis]|nr:hypothetical protein Q1695_005273 [Nippostrongylus brasiliensis]